MLYGIGVGSSNAVTKRAIYVLLMKVYSNFDEIIELVLEENLQSNSIIVSNSSKDRENNISKY